MLSVEYKEALVEVLEVLNHTDADLVDKIPKKFMEFITNNASKTYHIELNTNQSLEELELKEKTKDILAMLYRNFWCTAEQRNNYDKVLEENEEKYQAQLREKYNPDKLFENKNIKENIIQEPNSVQMIEYKENILHKLIHKIKNVVMKILKNRDPK